MHIRQINQRWITAAAALAIVWGLLAYAFHTHPVGTAGGQDGVCTVCVAVHRDAAPPPSLPQLLPPVARILLPTAIDTVPVAGAVTLPAYLSQGPPTV